MCKYVYLTRYLSWFVFLWMMMGVGCVTKNKDGRWIPIMATVIQKSVWCVSLNLFGTLRHIPNNITHTPASRCRHTKKKVDRFFCNARYSLIAPRIMIRKEKKQTVAQHPSTWLIEMSFLEEL